MTRSIYVVRSEPGPVKIGIAGKPRRRLSQLRTSSSVPLFMDFEAECVGDLQQLETRAHNILEAHRLSGEWFRVDSSAAIDAVIQAAKELGFVLMRPAIIPKKKRGRPKTFGTPKTIGVRVHDDAVIALDTWIASQPEPKPSRPEAIRLALKDWLSGLALLPAGNDLKDS